MAARRMFNEGGGEPSMPFGGSGQPDQQYAGMMGPTPRPAKRQLSSQDEDEMPAQRYIPPSTMEILLQESAKRGQR